MPTRNAAAPFPETRFMDSPLPPLRSSPQRRLLYAIPPALARLLILRDPEKEKSLGVSHRSREFCFLLLVLCLSWLASKQPRQFRVLHHHRGILLDGVIISFLKTVAAFRWRDHLARQQHRAAAVFLAHPFVAL